MADFSRIVLDPALKQGEPCLRGSERTVREVLTLLDDGRAWSAIIGDHPELQLEDLRAALAFAGAHLPNLIAATTPLQITRRLVNVDDIVDWATRVGFAPLRPLQELHVTLVYSRYDIHLEHLTMVPTEMRVAPSQERRLEGFRDNALVLTFEDEALDHRGREAWNSSGWQTEWPGQLHVTLAYGDNPELLKLEPYFGELVFGPEVLKVLPPLPAGERA